MASKKFCAFILSHGRPDKVKTLNTLRKCGYTGDVYIVVDNEDKAKDEYFRLHQNVIVFDKRSEAEKTDEGDNFQDRRAIIYARNASFEIAKKLGYEYFIQLDDDYERFDYRFDSKGFYIQKRILNLDAIFEHLVEFLSRTPFASVAIGQNGDYVGGESSTKVKSICSRRKAMNSFICKSSNPFMFCGKINEDVNTYTASQRSGLPFLTFFQVSLEQMQTQKNSGGMTDIYLDSGTYIKSFYSVMYAPSCVKISSVGHVEPRIHHRVDWNATAPLIMRDTYKKKHA